MNLSKSDQNQQFAPLTVGQTNLYAKRHITLMHQILEWVEILLIKFHPVPRLWLRPGFAPIFPDTCYHLTHYWLAAVDIPVASDNPVHYADAIRYNARTPLQGSLLPLTRLVWA